MKRILLSLCTGLFLINPLFAENHETSELQNPAQIQKAQNLSDASYENAQDDISEKQEDVEAKESSFDEKEANLQAAQIAFNNEVSPETTAALANAQAEFNIANQELNTAKDSLAQVSGTSVEDINEMRASGMGWGEIAHELGVHPSNLGLGNKNALRNKNTENFSIANKESKEKGLKGKASNSKINNGKNNQNAHSNSKGGNAKNGNSKGGNGKNK